MTSNKFDVKAERVVADISADILNEGMGNDNDRAIDVAIRHTAKALREAYECGLRDAQGYKSKSEMKRVECLKKSVKERA